MQYVVLWGCVGAAVTEQCYQPEKLFNKGEAFDLLCITHTHTFTEPSICAPSFQWTEKPRVVKITICDPD